MISSLVELILSMLRMLTIIIMLRVLEFLTTAKPITTPVGYVYISAPPPIRVEEVIELLRALTFKAYGYRHWVTLRSTNDVYDVVATPSYYVASDRNLVASPQVKEICTYSRTTGSRIKCIDVNADNSFDITEDYSKVVYYNHNSRYIEEATIPELYRTALFNPNWAGDIVNAIVKYVPGTYYSKLCVSRIGGNRVELRDKNGNVLDYMEFDKPIMAMTCEPGSYVVALAEGSITDLVDTIAVYSFYSHDLYGLIPRLFGRVLNMHVKMPFITIGMDMGFAMMYEVGGTPYNIFPINTNCLYPLLEDNVLVGTYYFSIFEFPLNPAFIPKEIVAFRKDITLDPYQETDISFYKGTILTIKSSNTIEVTVREPILINPGYYTKVYTSYPPEYVDISTVQGTSIVIEAKGKIWSNVKIRNVSGSTNVVKIMGGVA